jgi:hypothetical protein
MIPPPNLACTSKPTIDGMCGSAFYGFCDLRKRDGEFAGQVYLRRQDGMYVIGHNDCYMQFVASPIVMAAAI